MDKTDTHACCGQVAKEMIAPPAVVKREVAPVPKITAKPVPFSARAAQSHCDGKLPHRGEFSGPIALFFRVKEAAIASANDSDFGLGRLVFAKNIARVNNPDLADEYLPFGGVKTSGYGRIVWSHGPAIRQQMAGCELRRPKRDGVCQDQDIQNLIQ